MHEETELCFTFFSACPTYKANFKDTVLSINQDIELSMQLNLSKGMWDTGIDGIVSPFMQKINFFDNETDLFSFSLSLRDSNTLTKQVWLQTIDSSVYTENKYYSVSVEFFYETSHGVMIENCIGENGESTSSRYDVLDTSKWACFNNVSSGDPEKIDRNMVCDGIVDCTNESDESTLLCKPKSTLFETILTSFTLLYYFLGIALFLVLPKKISSPALCTAIVPTVVANWNTKSNKKDMFGYVNTIIDICMNTQKKMVGENSVMDKTDIELIRGMYLPCQKDAEKSYLFNLLYTLALNSRIKDSVYLIYDEIIKMEMEIHKTKGNAVRCIRMGQNHHSYLSLFLKEVLERNDFFAKNWTKLKNTIDVDKGILRPLILKLRVLSHIIGGLVNLILFYYDVVKDTLALNLLWYVKNTLLNDKDISARFDSVGGINFLVLAAYMISILILSELLIPLYAYNKRNTLKKLFREDFDTWFGQGFILLFPVHYVILGKHSLQSELWSLKDELVQKWQGHELMIDLVKTFQRNELMDRTQIVKDIMKYSNYIQRLQHRAYKINMIECNMQLLQSSFEREPQTVIQVCLFILMRRFKRISILFSAFSRFSTEWIVGILSLATILSITKTIFRHLHVHNWPLKPSIFGSICQILSIFFLVTSKIVLVSAALLNAYYLYPLIFIVNIFIIQNFSNLVSTQRNRNIFSSLRMALVPCFYKSSRPNRKSKVLKFIGQLLWEYPMLNTIILNFMTLVVYSAVGFILRKTMFHFNIRENYRTHISDVSEQSTNITTVLNSSVNKGVQETLTPFEKLLFEDQLRSFPIYFVSLFIICNVICVFLSSLYYKAFHPWRNILNNKEENKDDEVDAKSESEPPLQDENVDKLSDIDPIESINESSTCDQMDNNLHIDGTESSNEDKKDRMKEKPELEANGIIDEEANISISCKQNTSKISEVEFESDTGENIEEMFDFESYSSYL